MFVIKRIFFLINISLFILIPFGSVTTNKISIRTINTNIYNINDTSKTLDYWFEGYNMKINELLKFNGELKTEFYDLSEIEDYFVIENKECATEENYPIQINMEYEIYSTEQTLSIKIIYSKGEVSFIDEVIGYIFKNEDEEIDEILSLDDDNAILLSDFNNIIDECSFSNFIKSLTVKIIKHVAPITTESMNDAFSIKYGIDVIDKVYAINNYDNNCKLTDPNDFINKQADYSEWKLGLKTLDKNGCGAIATYNALRVIDRPSNLANVIYYYDITSGDLVFGTFGISPLSIKKYFDSNNILCNHYYYNFKLLKNECEKIDENQAIILLYMCNASNVFEGAHYITLKKEGSGYFAYNARIDYSTNLCDFYTNGRLLRGWIIG